MFKGQIHNVLNTFIGKGALVKGHDLPAGLDEQVVANTEPKWMRVVQLRAPTLDHAPSHVSVFRHGTEPRAYQTALNKGRIKQTDVFPPLRWMDRNGQRSDGL